MSLGLRSVVRQLPAPLVNRLKGTPVDTIYHNVIRQTIGTVELSVTCRNGSQSLIVPEDSIYVRSDTYEPVLVSTLCDRFQENTDAIYYDVGSEYGYYLALAQAAGLSDSNIYGFDMNPYAEHILSKNYQNTDVTITIGRVGNDTTRDNIVLDEIAADHQPPDIAKIDVEGAETLVLHGMKDILESAQPELFVEVHTEKLSDFGHSPEQVIRILREAGYQLLTTSHRETDADWRALDQKAVPDRETYVVWAQPQ